MREYIFIVIYLVVSCILVKEIAKHDSLIGIRVPQSIRKALLILSFDKPSVSVFAVIYQIYTYVMAIIFIWSRFMSLDFLISVFADPNLVYTYALRFQFFVLLPLTLIELGICYLVKRKQRSSLSAGLYMGDFSGTPMGLLDGKTLDSLAEDTESLLVDKVYDTDIDWRALESVCGIRGLYEIIKGEKAPTPYRSIYGKIVSRNRTISVICLTYREDKDAKKVVKKLTNKGLSKNLKVQMLLVKGDLKIVFA